MTDRLNRTSVGLKHGLERGLRCLRHQPQSNQRGIETHKRDDRLNQHALPQSNQRGIETILLLNVQFRFCMASIEPAWD